VRRHVPDPALSFVREAGEGDQRVTEDQGPRVFDMPHARVTLTPVGPNVEIEVWPKTGQSAYAVVDARVAILIAQQLVELAAAQLAAMQLTAAVGSTELGEGEGEGEAQDAAEEAAEAEPDNVVDLASRRPPGGHAG
jgi:hypothetical protein